MMKKFVVAVILFLNAAGIMVLLSSSSILADSVRAVDLKNQISAKNQEISGIEKEIQQYQEQLNGIAEEKNTLNKQIKQLQATASKLKAEISLTQKEIDNASLTIEALDFDIQNKSEQIKQSKESLAEIIRKMNEEESNTLVEILLANVNLSDFFSDLEQMNYLQKDVDANLAGLKQFKTDLQNQQQDKIAEQRKQKDLNAQLLDQKKIADTNAMSKNSLLKQTQNKESVYKTLLDEKIAKRDSFLDELSTLESQLKIEVDPNSIPSSGSGVLKWPLDSIFITQYFGNTPFATQNPQVYGGKGHNGVDFRASVGTPVKASLTGTIWSVGNTDAIRGCYSYGKWVLIKHNNGLSTLYAHLSLVKAAIGQGVATGEIIGYSGDTGFATGPHLHFGVYATQGVEVTKFTNSINCKNAIIPIADPSAYLNPLSYL